MKRRSRPLLYLLALVAVVYSLLPLYNIIIYSLVTDAQILDHLWYPSDPTLNSYKLLFGLLPFQEAAAVKTGLINSTITASAVMLLTLAVSLPAGYAIGRLRLRGKSTILALILGTRMSPPLVILLPYYIFFTQVHLRGTIPGLVLVQLSITLPVVAWVMIGFFSALPRDVEMCARMDGCTRFDAFRLVLLPLAAPGIAAGAVVAFLFSWNDYLYSLIMTSGTPAQTLTAFIGDVGGSVLAAAVVIQVSVAVVLGAFLQKYITSLKIVDPGTVAL